MIGLFLGAGFSKWALNLPLANQLFDFRIEPWGPREIHKLKIVKTSKYEWGKSNPNGLTEQFIAYAMNLTATDKDAITWYIGRRLSEPFIWKEFHAQKWRRHVLMIDEHRGHEIKGIIKARAFLMQFLTDLFGIITTNYDMVVEYVLGTKGFNYGIRNQKLIGRGAYPLAEWRNPITLRGCTSLAKIHGSISWDEHCFYTDGRRALAGHALIVPPTLEKKPPKSLRFEWKLAEKILRSITKLIIFGFSFNQYDVAVLKLLQLAGQNLKAVLLIDIEPKTKMAVRLWPTTKISTCLPPPEGKYDIKNWISINI